MFDRTNRSTIFILLVLGASLLLRTWNLDRYGIWYDEKISLLTASGLPEKSLESGRVEAHFVSGSLNEVKEATIHNTGGNSLVYHATLRFWITLFGNSDWAIRLLSVLFGMIVVVLLYHLTYQITMSRPAAFIVLVIAGIHPLLIEFSREAKSYSMALALILAASLVILRRPGRPLGFGQGVLYSALALAALFCHYFVVYVIGFHLLLVLWPGLEWKNRILGTLVPSLLILGTMGWWYAHGGSKGLASMAQRNMRYEERAAHFAADTDPFYTPATPANLVKGYLQALMPACGSQLQKMGVRIRFAWPFLLLPVVLFFWSWRFYRRSEEDLHPYRYLLIIPVWLGLMTMLALSSGHCISFQPLYGLFAVPFIALVSGWSLVILWENRRQLAAILIALFLGTTMVFSAMSSVFDLSFVQEPRSRNAVRTLVQQVLADHDQGEIRFRDEIDTQLFRLYEPCERCYSGWVLTFDPELSGNAEILLPESEAIPVFYEVR